jgi:hypothetical protein
MENDDRPSGVPDACIDPTNPDLFDSWDGIYMSICRMGRVFGRPVGSMRTHRTRAPARGAVGVVSGAKDPAFPTREERSPPHRTVR